MGLRVRFPSVSQMYLMPSNGRVGSSPTSGRNTRLKPPRGVFWVKLIQSIINNVINNL